MFLVACRSVAEIDRRLGVAACAYHCFLSHFLNLVFSFFSVAPKIADWLSESSLVLVANIQPWEMFCLWLIYTNCLYSLWKKNCVFILFCFCWCKKAERWLKKWNNFWPHLAVWPHLFSHSIRVEVSTTHGIMWIKDGDCDGVGEFNFINLYLPNQAIKNIFLFTNVAWKVWELDGVSLWFFDDYYGSFSCMCRGNNGQWDV